ncbi:hypothetical protein EW145_g5985 [Phellinidium pouzarii]|uniref:FAD dependent oxidoreductase domain-containing protein n=1 Tax=Phellinidium pouzarii TaxID=167371 RepID=A0A4S4KYB9_9AGAM|nr:hypothetical protein EW145_g5985 [Phellinidium pouzarii]
MFSPTGRPRTVDKDKNGDSGVARTISTSAAASLVPSSKIVIVGSGCFGISTALHLLRRGYTDVTVLDRAPVLPAVDAASTDINKIVRSSYGDMFYTRLAREAIDAWKNREEWGDNYHESGVLVLGSGMSIYADDAYKNDVAQGARVKRLVTSGVNLSDERVDVDSSVRSPDESIMLSELFHPEIPLGEKVKSAHAYLNVDGGWAFAEGGVRRAMQHVENLGGKILPAKDVSMLLKTELADIKESPDRQKSRTKGVKCKDGSEYAADIVVLATGSWTASAFPDLNLGEKCLASGQSVAGIKLTPEEAERYRSSPVVLNFGSSGFYTFPPNKDNVVKVAKHTGGVSNFVPIPGAPTVDAVSAKVSTPRTVFSHGADGLKIPRSEALIIRDGLREVYPELAEKPFLYTRLCWYTDSPDSDWIIDIHPDDSGLALVTSGSGHGYKFLPVIGRLAADRLEGKMATEVQKKFAIDRPLRREDFLRDFSRLGVLNVDELCGPDEL